MDMGSNVLKRNENGRTITGLYAYFYRHMKMQNTDKYGVCHTVVEKKKFYKCTRRTHGALQYLENEFKSQRQLGEKNYWNARRLDPLQR
jgi:hypothetical protein